MWNIIKCIKEVADQNQKQRTEATNVLNINRQSFWKAISVFHKANIFLLYDPVTTLWHLATQVENLNPHDTSFQGGPGPPPNNTGYCHDDETLLLMIPPTLVARHREIKIELGWKLPPCWLAFIAMQAARREKVSMVLLI